MYRDGPSGCRLVDPVVVGRTSITALGTTGAVAASSTGARSRRAMAAPSLAVGMGLVGREIGGRAGRLHASFRACLYAVPFRGSSDVSRFQVETTGVAYHRTRRRSPPQRRTLRAAITRRGLARATQPKNQKTNLQECPKNEVSFWDFGDDDSLSDADAFTSPDAYPGLSTPLSISFRLRSGSASKL